MMYISFASTEGMNVYIYEGVARDTATTSIIDGNSQVETDTLYCGYTYLSFNFLFIMFSFVFI